MLHKPNRLVNRLGENYAWAVCAACLVVLLCSGGLTYTGFSAYQPYLIRDGGLTNTQSSMLITIRSFTILLSMLFVDRLIRRWGPKNVMSLGMILCGTGFMIFGTAASYPGYCLAAALIGTAYGAGSMIPASVIISRWFNQHRATALGICMSATGLSSLLFSPLITYIVEHRNLRTCFIAEAVFVLLMTLLFVYLAYSSPGQVGQRPLGSEFVPTDRTYASRPAAPALLAVLILLMGCYGIAPNLMTSHISVLYSTENYAPGLIGLVTALYGGSMAVGKLLYGLAADHFGTVRASVLFYAMVVTGAMCCGLAGTGSAPLAVAAVVILGSGSAVSTVSLSVYAAGAATGPLYAQTLTRLQIAFNLGPLVFGRMPGMIADRTGSYTGAFRILGTIAAVSSALLLLTYRRIRREDR